MTYHHARFHSAITAAAAVFALSSTPLFAQDAGPADTTVETPPVASDPLAPEPLAEPAPIATETATETAAEPPPASRPKVETATAKAPRASASRAARPARSAAPPPAATAVAESPVAASPAPLTGTEPVAGPVAPPVEPVETPPAAEPSTSTPTDFADALMTDERLQIGGGAAAGLLAIGALAMAIRRRKRRQEEERLEEAKWAIIEAAPDVETRAEPEPAFARPAAQVPPATTAAQAQGAAAKLPNGFDPSQFGRHVEAAYRGPTPDNPSVSLEYRLHRASVLDQQEQDAKEAAAGADKDPDKGNWESRSDADSLFRRGGANQKAKPEYQR